MGRSGQVCLVMVKVSVGESRPTEPFARLGVYKPLTTSWRSSKKNQKGLSVKMASGGTLPKLTLRKAKCVVSKPHASNYRPPFPAPSPTDEAC